MNFQDLIDAVGKAGHMERSKYHLTLGDLIDVLDTSGGEDVVRFDDTPMGPGHEHSYRGYYTDLSFEPTDQKVCAATLLEQCKRAIGQTYTGYKGGDFIMDKDTPLWSANHGDCGRAIIGAVTTPGRITLITKQVD